MSKFTVADLPKNKYEVFPHIETTELSNEQANAFEAAESVGREKEYIASLGATPNHTEYHLSRNKERLEEVVLRGKTVKQYRNYNELKLVYSPFTSEAEKAAHVKEVEKRNAAEDAKAAGTTVAEIDAKIKELQAQKEALSPKKAKAE